MNGSPMRETPADIHARFGIAQDGKPTEAQLQQQALLRQQIADLAVEINAEIEDSREKSLALTHLEDALMWAGKAIFR